MSKRKKALVVGQGYVGLPLSMALVASGFEVVGVDLDDNRVLQISGGNSPIGDVDSSQLVAALDSGLYSITTTYSNCNDFAYAVITVPTPLREGEPDLSFIRQAGASISRLVSKGSTVILESTSYPGTTEELLVPILESGSGLTAGEDFLVGYSPERIDPGNPNWGLLNIPKVVSGINRDSHKAVKEFYEGLGISTVEVSGTREAELTKLLENTFRHVNIALVNEIAVFSDALGINVWEAVRAAGTKPFGFMGFSPGPGVGGHCLPVDPSYLSWAVQKSTGKNFEFVDLANKINSHMPSYVSDRAVRILQESHENLLGVEVLLFGLAYKANTADIREAPSLHIANLLLDKGLDVYAIDEFVNETSWPVRVKRIRPRDKRTFPLGIMVTPHEYERELLSLGNCDTLLDTRGILSGKNVRHL